MKVQELLGERRKLGGLLLTAHRQIWRGVAFLRSDQRDVDDLVPSLYVPPGVPKRRTARAPLTIRQ